MDTHASIVRSAKNFFGGTALSRVMGLVRDLAMAFCFGSAPEVAAFMVAYRLSNLFRRLFGEGNLQGGFIPQFEQLRSQDEPAAARFYRDLSYSIGALLCVCVLLGGGICWLCSQGMQSDIPLMTLYMMPGVIFLCLYALNSAVLQCQKRYFLPAAAPSFFNLAWVISVAMLSFLPTRTAMFGLSFCLLGAFGVQWLCTFLPVFRWSIHQLPLREWLSPQLFSKEVRGLLRPIAFGVLGVGAAQINSALDAIFARIADPAGPAYLWYAIRVQQLPLSLLGIALAGALLPPLSRAFQANAMDRFNDLLSGALKKSALLIIPCSFAMVSLATAGIDLLFGRGEFSPQDVARTAFCLQGYALGLAPMVFVLLLANGCYAQKEYRIPVRCSVAAVLCNAALNALFVFGFHLGAISIALATSLSALLNFAMLYSASRCRLAFWKGLPRLFLCSLGASIATAIIDGFLPESRVFAWQLSRFALLAAAFLTTLAGLAYVLNVKELVGLFREFQKQSANYTERDSKVGL